MFTICVVFSQILVALQPILTSLEVFQRTQSPEWLGLRKCTPKFWRIQKKLYYQRVRSTPQIFRKLTKYKQDSYSKPKNHPKTIKNHQKQRSSTTLPGLGGLAREPAARHLDPLTFGEVLSAIGALSAGHRRPATCSAAGGLGAMRGMEWLDMVGWFFWECLGVLRSWVMIMLLLEGYSCKSHGGWKYFLALHGRIRWNVLKDLKEVLRLLSFASNSQMNRQERYRVDRLSKQYGIVGRSSENSERNSAIKHETLRFKKVDTVYFNCLLTACARRRQWDGALQVLDEMEETKAASNIQVRKNETTYL